MPGRKEDREADESLAADDSKTPVASEENTGEAGQDTSSESDSPDGASSPYSDPSEYTDSYNYDGYGGEAVAQTDEDSSRGESAKAEDSKDSTDDTEADDEEEGGGPVKPFLEHLEDLRWTLVKCVTALVLGMLVCLVAGKFLVSIMMWPLKNSEKVFRRNKDDVAILVGSNVLARVKIADFGGAILWGTNRIGALEVVPVTVGTNTILALKPEYGESKVPPPMMVVIKNYGPIEGIMVALKLALYGGLVLSLPFIIFFVGQFVLPALHFHEKKLLYQSSGFAAGLFLIGIVFCYFIVAVFALGATVEFSRWLGFGSDEWRADAYLSFMAKFMLGMGLAFELPVIILVLVKIGLLDYDKLKRFRSYAVVGNLVIAAFATPSGDPFTMLLMALPLHLLYELSVFVAWYWERRDRKTAEAEGS